MNEIYMKVALKEAQKAYNKGEIPVGCVIVKDGKVITKTHNLKETKHSSLCHAEILAIFKASKKIRNWRLLDCDIYVTMEPCPMCASAIKQSRIKKVVYGFSNDNNKISRKILETKDINDKVEIIPDVLENECKEIIKKFFKNKRK